VVTVVSSFTQFIDLIVHAVAMLYFVSNITALKLVVRLFVVSEVIAVILNGFGYSLVSNGINTANAAFNVW
jgi:hypothetical protein